MSEEFHKVSTFPGKQPKAIPGQLSIDQACTCTSSRTCAVCLRELPWLCYGCGHTKECCKGDHKPFAAMTEGHLCEGPEER